MIIRGYKHSLEFKDLWALNKADTSHTIVPKFEAAWNTEVKKAKWLVLVRKIVRPPPTIGGGQGHYIFGLSV